MQQQKQASDAGIRTPDGAPVQQIAENPNPRANENIRHAEFEPKADSGPGNDVGTEITDGEAG